eukprot:jgi/Chrzof1/508/Cz01g18120.t1
MLHLPLHFQRTSAATLPARCCSHVPCIRKLRLQHGWKPIRTISRTPYGKLSCTAAVSSPAVADSTQASDLGDTLGSGYELNMPNWNKGRRAGIILHPTSLPGPYGIGELGSEALAFIDWLHTAGMQMWQVLPLVPPDPEYFSPYSGLDANCGNPLLISIDALISEGLLDPEDAPAPVAPGPVDYPAVAAVKNTLLTKAAHRLLTAPEFAGLRELLQHWQQQNPWIEDSAVFDTLRQQSELQPLPWWQWPEDLRFRKPKALQEVNNKFQQQISEFKAIQFLFDRQWKAVKVYANSKGVKIIGDMPIYVGGQSADVWANPHLFELNNELQPDQVSGVPPDAFSATGQLWGSPLYRWPAHRAEGYKWWTSRMQRALQLYDETRIDHFRAFTGYWSVAATEETAMNGVWRKGPGHELFDALMANLGNVPILAEDLGVITDDVVHLRQSIKAPGMVVLQFAWGGGTNNVHLPHMHYENSFCYPGTHDNETSVGWFKDSANEQDKMYLKAYLGTEGEDIAWDFIRCSMQSVSSTCVFLMQDVMRLDNTGRMNVPGKAEGNWSWRMGDSTIYEQLETQAADLKKLAYVYNRLPPNVKVDY